MPAFVISYVPNVENIDNVEFIKRLETVDKVKQVENVQNVEFVETVDNVNTVHDVRKLPHPYFPLKKFNYQYGGWVHITNTTNRYQAVYLPPYDCEFKGVDLSFTSYNIEDTYDVMIGSRYIIQGSHVKEMAESRRLEVYEVVNAGTPIVVEFHNKSGLEKFMMFEFVCIFDEKTINYPGNMTWNFFWQDANQYIPEQDTMSLIINQPNYVNMESHIDNFSLQLFNLNTTETIGTITVSSNGTVTSSYVEDIIEYQGMGFLGRVNVIAVLSVTKFSKSIQVVFKNISNHGASEPHPIEIGIRGLVNNVITGGIE